MKENIIQGRYQKAQHLHIKSSIRGTEIRLWEMIIQKKKKSFEWNRFEILSSGEPRKMKFIIHPYS